MPIGRIFLSLFGMAALGTVVFLIAVVVDVATSSGGGCGGG